MRHRSEILLALVVTTCLPVFAGDGDLDPAFGGSGLWVSAAAGSFSSTRAAMAPDGALVIFGSRNLLGTRSFHWRRVLPSGAGPLCSYEPAGATNLDPGGISFDYAGRMLFSGRVTVSPSSPVVALLRFNYPACALDSTLDGDGYATYAPGVTGTTLAAVSGVEPVRWFDGLAFRNRILVPLALDSGPRYDAHLLRLYEGGAIDTGFGGGDGILALRLDSLPQTIARAHDGQLLVAGVTADGGTGRSFVLKFDRDGLPIAAFGVGGETVVDLPGSSLDSLGQVAVAPDGRIALVGRTDLGTGFVEQGAAAVLTKNGALDLSFSGDGWTTWQHAGSDRTDFRAAAFQGDGKLLLAGRATDPLNDADDEAFAIRLLANGGIEGGFGTSGVTWIELDDVVDGEELGSGIGLSTEGGIWLAGSTAVETTPGNLAYQPFAARLQNSYIFADGFDRGSVANW